MLDCRAFGGQAGASARIENYLGFPTGISGMALMARAYNQAQKFGAEMAIPDEVVRLQCPAEPGAARFQLGLAGDERVRARAVVIASGARYRRLDVANLDAFEGTSRALLGLTAGGDALRAGKRSRWSAPATRPARPSSTWRRRSPRSGFSCAARASDASMSRYLVDRIAALPNVEVLAQTQVTALEGDGRCARGGALAPSSVGRGDAATDPPSLSLHRRRPEHRLAFGVRRRARRQGVRPHRCRCGDGRRALETSRDGVFAIGDVRAGSIKRVAAAVGEGAQVIATLHAFLAAAAAEPPRAATSQLPAFG